MLAEAGESQGKSRTLDMNDTECKVWMCYIKRYLSPPASLLREISLYLGTFAFLPFLQGASSPLVVIPCLPMLFPLSIQLN